jgi:hypothetical protein
MSSMDGKSENTLKFWLPWSETRQNPERDWSDRQRSAAATLWPDHVPDPANAIDINDIQKLNWKQYQLFKTTLKIDRRDSVYQAFATSDFTNGSAAHNWLGAPFPIIEQRPTPGELIMSIRWYEHVGAFVSSLTFYAYIRGKPSARYAAASVAAQRGMCYWTFLMLEMGLGHRSSNRLRGCIENDYECEKYGVLENQQRLAEKAKYWEKYRKYKEEWMKRYDYYVFGMRPGERYTLLSPCHIPPAAVLFSKRTDFKLRKNPFILSEHKVTPAEMKTAHDAMGGESNFTPGWIQNLRAESKYYGPMGALSKTETRRTPPSGVMFT